MTKNDTKEEQLRMGGKGGMHRCAIHASYQVWIFSSILQKSNFEWWHCNTFWNLADNV